MCTVLYSPLNYSVTFRVFCMKTDSAIGALCESRSVTEQKRLKTDWNNPCTLYESLSHTCFGFAGNYIIIGRKKEKKRKKKEEEEKATFKITDKHSGPRKVTKTQLKP